MKKFYNKFIFYLKGKYIYLLIIFLASIPLLNDSLIKMGEVHDIYFHLMRIEGITEGLKSGQFPVKIQPGWYEGYGYGCSVFYGDIFLYIPAVLNMLGMPIQNTYKVYVLLCNIATAGISGYCFERMFESKKLGMLGSFLYTLSVYRLLDVYVRTAVGEYTAMIFLPMIVYAVYLLIKNKEELRKGWILLSLGMTGIIQCHIISAEIVIVMLGLLCVVFFKRIFNKRVLFAFAKAVFLTLVLNLGFIIPLVDYMLNGKFNVNAINGGWRVEQNIQQLGITIVQLGQIFYDPRITEIGVGFALVLSIPFFLISFLRKYKTKQTNTMAWAICFFSVLSLWMSTKYFPWEAIRKSNTLFRYMVINIQFPWRLCMIATLSLVLLWCIISKQILGHLKRVYCTVVISIVVIFTIMSAGYMLGTIITFGEYYKVMSVSDMNTRVKSGEEYLPVYTLSDELEKDTIVSGKNVSIWNMQRKGIRIEFECKNRGESCESVDIPLIYYKGYRTVAVDKKQQNYYKLDTLMGKNNVVEIQLPPQFEGKVTVDFKEPLYWRVAEILSAITVLSLIVLCRIGNKKERVSTDE